MHTLLITTILINLVYNQNSNKISPNDSIKHSFICVSRVPRSYLQTPIQLETQNSTFEIILIQLSFQQIYNIFKVDVDNFKFYSTTFEVDDVLRYNMPVISTIETFDFLLDSDSIVDILTDEDTRKYIYTGDQFSFLRKFYEFSAVSEFKTNKTTADYILGVWLRTNEKSFNMFERDLNIIIKQNNPNELTDVTLKYLNTKCEPYQENSFKNKIAKLDELAQKSSKKGMTGFIYQAYFENVFEDVKIFFEQDPSLFFEELQTFKLGELTTVELPDELIELKEVNSFTTGAVIIKDAQNKFCWFLFGGILALIVVGGVLGIIMGK